MRIRFWEVGQGTGSNRSFKGFLKKERRKKNKWKARRTLTFFCPSPKVLRV